MRKVLDKDLTLALEGLSAEETVARLKGLQDASGLKVCTAITKTVPAYMEV